VDSSDGSWVSGAVAQQITFPRTVNVVTLRSTVMDGQIYTAVLSSKGGIYLIKGTGTVVEYRFYTGIPEFNDTADITGHLFWSSDGLVVSGVNGAVLLPNSVISNL